MKDNHSHDSHGHHKKMNDTEVIKLGGKKEYTKFFLVIFLILAISTFITASSELSDFMRTFMAIYMLAFGAFKIAGLKMFVHSYGMYDILAKVFPAWSYVYPFVELVFGLCLLFSVQLDFVYVLLLALMSFNAAGVVNELGQKNKIRCACLGSFVKLPITTITLAEDVLMAVMAAIMLLI